MRSFLTALILLWGALANANICGTDYQNFNPTTSGLDFVTVHSSETLKPCLISMGLFFNYAKNSLTYSKNLPGITAGDKPGDSIVGGDLSIGMGLTDNWDVGLSLPMVLSQELNSPYYVSAFDKKGLTEVKLGTKYRFSGDDSGGFAGVFSINNNLIENNPFAGSGAGPTLNFELVADTTWNRWAVAGNIGYRKRNPGRDIPNQPFVPMQDQYIYSLATSYLFPSIDTKVIFEFYGSRATKAVDQQTDKSLNASEILLGLKHDWSSRLALNLGGSAEVLDSIGSPDFRIYAGMNYAFGLSCENSKAVVEKAEYPRPLKTPISDAGDVDDHNYPVERFEGKLPEIYRFPAEVLFAFDSDRIRNIVIPDIENLIRELKSGGFKRLVIEGHTDSVGARSYNQGLSERRARQVRQYLIDKYYVLPERVFTKGYGEDRPIADNGNFQGRQKNRRVEFKIWR